MIVSLTLFIQFIFISTVLCFTKKVCDYYSDRNGFYTMNMQIGNPLQLRYFQINLESEFNWIQSSSYEKNSSTTCKIISKEEIEIDNQKVECEFMSDELKFIGPSIELDNFMFYRNEDASIKGFTSLSFALTPKHFSHSLVSMLRTRGIINNNRFGFVGKNLFDSKERSYIYFGDIPEEIKTTVRNGTCKVDINERKWGCRLNSLFIHHDAKVIPYEVNHFAVFTSIDNIIEVPNDVMKYIEDNLFKQYFDSNACIMYEFPNFDHIECDMESIKQFKGITFLFEGIGINLNIDDLFIVMNKRGAFNIRNNKKNNQWRFGTFFLRKFILLFDYDERAITFYSDKLLSQEDMNLSYRSIKKTIIIINTLTLILFSIVLLYNRIYK